MPILLISLVFSGTIFVLFPEIDLAVSGYFYNAEMGKFPLRDNLIAIIIYKSIYVLSYTLGISLTLSLLFKKIGNKWLKDKLSFVTNRQVLFLMIIMAAGPGVIIHNVFKPNFERPRPVNTQEFGGSLEFSSAWKIGQGGKSFASGHAAMGFFMVAFAHLAKGKRRKKLYMTGFTFGIIVSMGRVVQGAHFLSDVVTGGLITLITIQLFYIIMYKKVKKPK